MTQAPSPIVTLVRHGQTQWSLDGRHTGTTDVPLTTAGEEQARRLVDPLARFDFDLVVTSPRRRAIATAELAGFTGRTEVWEDLAEWDYGKYEGITSPQIWEWHPGWNIFEFGAPDGESPAEIGQRADRTIAELRDCGARRIAVFAHNHILRVIGARWIELEPREGIRFTLSTASISELGYERSLPAFTRWNDTSHLADGV